jgi:GTP cyclohydrolase I
MTTSIFDNVHRDEAMAAIHAFLVELGLDPECADLKDTPRRITDMFAHFFRGHPDCWTYQQMPELTMFDNDEHIKEMVLLRDIEFVSICSHHFLPFHGTADIAYYPRDKLLGISKLARVLDHFAARPQLQERLAKQVAEGLQAALNPLGVAVRLRAKHGCISHRGAYKPGSVMVTTILLGSFQDNDSSRETFLRALEA